MMRFVNDLGNYNLMTIHIVLDGRWRIFYVTIVDVKAGE
jgi:hypothetical protein